MGSSQINTHKKDDKKWVFLILFLIGIIFIFSSQNSEIKNTQQDPVDIKRVDSHLKDTSYNVETDRRQRQIEVYQQLNKFRNSTAQTPYRKSSEFSLESDPYMQSLTQDLNRSRQSQPEQYTPEEIVQQKLYENDQIKKASEAYREAYAAEFKENARRGGWDIELGPNFEVLSVKKIKEKRNPSLFQEDNMSSSR